MTQQLGSPSTRSARSRRVLAWSAAILVVALVVAAWWRRLGPWEDVVTLLDPAKVRVVRTPGGMLEVVTLQKEEQFGWRVSHSCPPLDCGELFGSTTSEIRVTAHVTYRIPLAAQWTLRLDKDHYELRVPPLEAKKPVAFDTAGMQIRTEKSGWLSPAAGPNREAVVRHLGIELDRRADAAEYKRLAEPRAAATVDEFARKWMREQGAALRHPIRVSFGDDAAKAPAD